MEVKDSVKNILINMKSCTLVPKIGANLMENLRSHYPYKVASRVFLQATNPHFINDYRHQLELDEEGIPTYGSIMNNTYIKSIISKQEKLDSLNKNYRAIDDTIENYDFLIDQAYEFNTNNENASDHVAIVDYTDNGKLKVKIVPKTEEALENFYNQYSSTKLNSKIANIFSKVGITVGNLTEAETRLGRVGVTDFSKVKGIADSFESIIRVANNKEGSYALSEEFAHLMIGVFKEDSLVKRSLAYLEKNIDLLKDILGDQYEDVVSFYDNNMALVAEEALGHILQHSLLNLTQNDSVFGRASSNIQSKFKDYDETDVQNAKREVAFMMNIFAKEILDDTKSLTKDQIEASKRDVQLNALSDRIDRNVKMLKEQIIIEKKRSKITSDNVIKEYAKNNVNTLESYSNLSADTELGIYIYCSDIVENLKQLNMNIRSRTADSMTAKEYFSMLRDIKRQVDSYKDFLKSLNEAIYDEESEEDNMFLKEHELKDHSTTTVKQIVTEIEKQLKQLTLIYTKKSKPAFMKFLKPFLGDRVTESFSSRKGEQLTLEELFDHATSDISMLDALLDAMCDSSDMVLQIFDRVVKQQKYKAREHTIDAIRKIQQLRKDAEAQGITDFEWMFARDEQGNKTGYYISECDYNAFYKAYEEEKKRLDEKYGTDLSDSDAGARRKELEKWRSTYATSKFGKLEPKPELWKSIAYSNLSDVQKDFLNKFLEIKETYDELLPKSKASRLKAIQIRKDFSQRLIESGSMQNILSNLKGRFEENFLDSVDDDQIFGDVRLGMTDFLGHEYMTLPVLYTQRLKQPNDLSTDVFSTLLQYVYMAENFDAMNQVIDALEVGREIVINDRKVDLTRGGKVVKEKFGKYTKTISKDKTFIEDKINTFFESQVYGRYLQDNGSVTGLITKNEYNVSKFVSWTLKCSSLASLGFNWLANIANVTTGVCMQHIECAARQHFTAKELFEADREYKHLLTSYIQELGSRMKQSKLALFDEMIDFKGNFRENLKSGQKKNWLQRLFGENIAFFGQDAGDHWLYNRTAIAMAKHTKINVPGMGEVSVWDALQIVRVEGTDYNKMVIPEGATNLDGSKFSMFDFSKEILGVNQRLFGIYNEEDSNAANRTITGRLLLQFRKWMKPQYNVRFQAAQKNLLTRRIDEGYYRTCLRLIKEFRRGDMQWSQFKDQMTEDEKANVRRALFEISQLLAVMAIVKFVPWDDDKHRPYAEKLAEYSAKRLLHELGGLTPSHIFVQEMLKNVKNPVPATQPLIDLTNMCISLISPEDYMDEIQSGPYKGMSTAEKNIVKSPIPIIRQYRMVDKFVNELDASIDYYARPY